MNNGCYNIEYANTNECEVNYISIVSVKFSKIGVGYRVTFVYSNGSETDKYMDRFEFKQKFNFIP